ncbi:MAG: hypothetical protein ACYTG0_38025 [Planctomycetota bacterium]|jgi:hypothetical protein
MKKGGFSGRGRGLEDRFFHEHDQKLLEALREQTASKERKKALADASGITDDDLLGQLDKLDISGETVVALSLIPLIAVAWADGNVDVKERAAVLAAAEQKGIEKEHPAHQLLECWLKRKPDGSLLAVWKDYVATLSQTLSPSAKSALKEEVLGRARGVAEAAGGLLGFGSKVSKVEQAVLSDLEKALG